MSFKEKVYRRTESGQRVITIAHLMPLAQVSSGELKMCRRQKIIKITDSGFDSKQNCRNFFCFTCCGLDVKHSQMQYHYIIMIKWNIILI